MTKALKSRSIPYVYVFTTQLELSIQERWSFVFELRLERFIGSIHINVFVKQGLSTRVVKGIFFGKQFSKGKGLHS